MLLLDSAQKVQRVQFGGGRGILASKLLALGPCALGPRPHALHILHDTLTLPDLAENTPSTTYTSDNMVCAPALKNHALAIAHTIIAGSSSDRRQEAKEEVV